MTTPNEPNHSDDPDRSQTDIDGVFADLVASMPDLASTTPTVGAQDLEIVEIVVPHPHAPGRSMRLALEVPSEVAPMVRAEFSPDRIAAMMQAVNALAALSVPPKP